jgi:catechol 2,3-dioxygenase-like lactoylglutathione lyase family enzyme
MIDHTGVIVSDFEKSKKFYSDALEPIGYTLLLEFPPSVTGGMNVAGFGEPPKRTSGSVRALRIIPGFTSRFESASARWWTYFIKPRLRPGGKDNGAPGLRPQYHANYCGAFVFDPDGHNIEAVCHEAPA